MAGRIRAALILLALAPITLVLTATQSLALRRGWRLAETLPTAFHRLVCALLRVRIVEIGRPSPRRPLLIVANHVSWLDISVIGSRAPLSFIAKSEVAGWPLIGLFARLQRSVFVDRRRGQATAAATAEIARRLAAGEALVLFAEGTTSDGNRVLPFRSALLGAARAAVAEAGRPDDQVLVQPLAIGYPRRAGLPLARAQRPAVAWYGDMTLGPHLMAILRGPPLDAVVVWGEPIPFDQASDRKLVAKLAWQVVRDARAALAGNPAAGAAFHAEANTAKDTAVRR